MISTYQFVALFNESEDGDSKSSEESPTFVYFVLPILAIYLLVVSSLMSLTIMLLAGVWPNNCPLLLSPTTDLHEPVDLRVH